MALAKENTQDILNLTTIQEGMLFHYLNSKDYRLYQEQLSFSIKGILDYSLMEKALSYVIIKTPLLRTVFRWKNLKRPLQIVLKEYKVPTQFVDLCSLEPNCFEEEAKKIKDEMFASPMDLEEHPFKICYIKRSENECILVLHFHHILFDGWSLAIILNELFDIYQKLLEGKAPVVKIRDFVFKDYLKWQNEKNEASETEFWKKYLFGYQCKSLLPMEQSQRQTIDNEEIKYTLSQQQFDQVTQFLKDQRITTSVFVNAIWSMLLHRCSKEEDLVFGTLVSGRPSQITGIESSVGLYVNTIPLRVSIHQTMSFLDLIKEVNEKATMRIPYESTALTLIQNTVENKLVEGIFDHLVVVENYPIHLLSAENKIQVKVDSVVEITSYPIVLRVMPFDGLELVLSYDRKKFAKSTVEYLLHEFIHGMEQAIAGPERLIKDFEMFSSKRIESKNPKLPVNIPFEHIGEQDTKHITIAGYLEKSWVRYSEKIAIITKSRKMSYKELDELSNQIGVALQEDMQESFGHQNIALLFEHGCDMILGLLAALKTGEMFVSLDTIYPKERLSFIVENAEVRFLVTNTKNLSLAKEIKKITNQNIVICNIDEILQQEMTTKKVVNHAKPEDIAFLLYTSGSTGNPKGVIETNTNVLFHAAGYINALSVNDQDRMALFTTYSHAVAMIDILSTLMTGGTLLPYNVRQQNDIYEVAQWLQEEKITIYHSVPTIYRYLMQSLPNDFCFHTLRLIVLGGEAVNLQEFEMFQAHVTEDCVLANFFGASEVLTASFSYLQKSSQLVRSLVPIGKFIPGLDVFLLDENQNQVDVFGVGEIVYKSKYLATKYWKETKKSDKYVELGSGIIQFSSGDLGRLLPDGNVEYYGRKDFQIKINGHRVETSEIETLFNEIPNIKKSLVLYDTIQTNGKGLIAYYSTKDGKEMDEKEIGKHLRETLPLYMVPSRMIHLDQFPLNANGKVERSSLPKPEVYQDEENHIDTTTEKKMMKLWKEILGINQVNYASNFFELGGHSLKVFAMVTAIQKEFGVQLQVSDVYYTSTLTQLAKLIEERLEKIERVQQVKENQIRESLIKAVPKQEFYELSRAQQRVYFHSQSLKGSTVYNETLAVEIEGEFEVERVQEIFKDLVKRHDSLRTCIRVVEGKPVQVILDEVSLVVNYLRCNPNFIHQTIHNFIRPFYFEVAPLMRVGLIEVEQDKHILLIDMHHIITDGTSMSVLSREFASLYLGEKLSQVSLRYIDYTKWQNERIEQGCFRKEQEYWLKQFDSRTLPILNLPHLKKSTQEGTSGGIYRFQFDQQLTNDLKQLSLQTKASLFILLLAMYNVELHRYTGQEDIIVGTPVAGRMNQQLNDVVGMFVNMLPMESVITEHETFQDYLERFKTIVMQGFDHQEYPFDLLVDQLSSLQGSSKRSLYDTIFVLQTMDFAFPNLPNLSMHRYEINTFDTPYEIAMKAYEENGKLYFSIEYQQAIFEEEFIEMFAAHYQGIAKQIIDNLEIKIDEISMITKRELHQIDEFNDTKTDYSKNETIHGMFEHQVQRAPNQIAVLYEDQAYTYHEFNQMANHVAELLLQKGVKRNDIVGVYMERSVEMLVAIYGILKAGGAYLPISPDFPSSKISFMLEDSNANVVLTQSKLKFDVQYQGERILVDYELIKKGEYENPDVKSDSKDLAYIIYTSGTTGKSKAVMIEHHSVINRLQWMQKKFPLTIEDIILQKTPYIFDVSVWELFWWGWYGAKICLLEHNGEKSAGKIVQAIFEKKITTIHFVPSMLNAFLNHLENEKEDIKKLTSLKIAFCSGEALDMAHVKRFNKVFANERKLILCNLYGPTEATVDVTYYVCSREDEDTCIPIGKPIDNTRAYILNKEMKVQPIGVAGELYLSGVQIARGYLNNKELTAQRFLADIKNTGETMYKTGDLARWRKDGNIQYLGRIDEQVKIRGYRIELEEVRLAISKYPKVKEAVVVDSTDEDGEKFLCSYFIPNKKFTVTEIRDFLENELPSYMIPTAFVLVDAIPTTINGKLDRRNLPKPETNLEIGDSYLPAQDKIEECITKILHEMLSIEKIGTKDDFFALGLNSIKAMKFIARLHQECEIDVSLNDVYKSPTVRELATKVRSAKKNQEVPLLQVEKRDYYPLSPAQKRIYLSNALKGNDHSDNNTATVFLVEGKLDEDLLQKAFDQMINRHEILRTAFKIIRDEPVQVIQNHVSFEIEREQAKIQQLDEIIDRFIRPFNLEKAPLMRFKVVELKKDHYAFLLDAHHIIFDGVSKEVVMKELVALYQNQEVPELKYQYKDYAIWQNAYLETDAVSRQKEYWLKEYENALPQWELFTDYERPKVVDFEGDAITFEISEEITNRLNKIAKDSGASMYMTIMAVYNILLHKYSGQDDIVVGVPTFGRPFPELDPLIGMFVNTLAIRNYPKDNLTFLEFLQQVKEKSLNAFENQDYQFDMLVKDLGVLPSLGRNALFDTMLAFQNTDRSDIVMDKVQITSYPMKEKVTTFDLVLHVYDGALLICKLTYSKKLFKIDTIQQFIRHFIKIANTVSAQPQILLENIDIFEGAKTKTTTRKEEKALVLEFDF